MPHFDEKTTTVNRAHVVVVIGCTEKDDAEAAWHVVERGGTYRDADVFFTFHDPANFPFMTATAHELMLASTYHEEDNSSKIKFRKLSLGWFLAVTPKSVSMPLLDEATGDRAGIRTISDVLKTISFIYGTGLLVRKKPSLENHRSKFKLLTATQSNILDALVELFPESTREYIEMQRHEFFQAVGRIGAEQWCWLEVERGDVLLWDAQKSVSKQVIDELYKSFRLARNLPNAERQKTQVAAGVLGKAILIGASVWQEDRRRNETDHGNADKSHVPVLPNFVLRTHVGLENSVCSQCYENAPAYNKPSISASLLSSYEIVKDWSNIPIGDGSDPVDLYVFMQRHADRILLTPKDQALLGFYRSCEAVRRWLTLNNRIFPIRRPSALFLMAKASENEELIIATASDILRLKREVVSISTYLPNLSSGAITPDYQNNKAMLALKFVLKVVQYLKKFTSAPLVQTIHLVGGTRLVTRILPNNSPGSYFIRCFQPTEAIQGILECLSFLLPEIEAANVNLAFEYEPSDMCALGSMESLTDFCGKIRKLSTTNANWKRIGIHLNLANWGFTDRFEPGHFPEGVRERVFHAHTTLGQLDTNTNQKLLAWVMLFEELRIKHDFSGLISLKLECAKTKSSVDGGLKILKECLNIGQ